MAQETDLKPESEGTLNAGAARFAARVRTAMSVGDIELARRLAAEGHACFPANTVLQNLDSALARPRIKQTGRPANQGITKSQSWLREHAEQYRGQWVALRDGELLGSASELSELRNAVPASSDLFVTKIA